MRRHQSGSRVAGPTEQVAPRASGKFFGLWRNSDWMGDVTLIQTPFFCVQDGIMHDELTGGC